MIDVQQVRELAEVLTEHALSEIRLRQGEDVIVLRKGPAGDMAAWPVPVAPQVPSMPGPMAPAPSAAGGGTPTSDEGLVPVVSPMVGTYYSAPDPESPPFVAPGTELEVGSPVCIIEAMKVFNEIKAEIAGRVERVLVKNEQAVEYGQPLILVRPRA